MFQAIRKNFEKSRWTVTRQWSEVTRPSARLSNNVFLDVSSDLGKFFEKSRWTVTRQWLEVTRLVGRLSNQRFLDVSSNQKFYLKKVVWTVTRQWSEVTRPSAADWQTTVFWTFQAIWENFDKKSLNGHATVVGGQATRRPTVKQRFLDVSSDLGKFGKKSLNGHATVVGGHATVGRLSNNVFGSFKQLEKKFEKSRWTVTRQWSEVTRPSADCQTTFFWTFQAIWEIFWKKSLNGHATVVGGHATVGWLSNNVFWTFQAIRKTFL